MLTNEQRKEFLQKELEISKRYLEMVDVLQEVTKGFVGKVFNIRYVNALEEAINKRFSKDERKAFFVTAEPFTNCFCIRITCSDNHMVFNQEEGRCDKIMLRNCEKSFVLPSECTTFTKSGRVRFEEDMIEALEEHKTEIRNEIDMKNQDLILCENSFEDFQKIQESITEFEKKYSHNLRTTYGAMCSYVNQGYYKFRN